VVLDPYRPGGLGGRIGHGAITTPADVVVVTHFHEDHGWIGGVPGEPQVVDGDWRADGENPLEVRCAWIQHDNTGGDRMGLSRMMAVSLGGLTVLHPGDPGRLPTQAELAPLWPIDILLLPVGGVYTLGLDEAEAFREQVAARWTVPMHYRSDKVDLPMATRAEWLTHLDPAVPRRILAGSILECARDVLSEPAEVVLLESAL